MGGGVERKAYLLAGPTASGKSAIAAALAREMGAWILSADSMLVYKGMDIGTAKPPPEEVAEFHFVHRVLFEAAFRDGALAMPMFITEVKGGGLRRAP